LKKYDLFFFFSVQSFIFFNPIDLKEMMKRIEMIDDYSYPL